VTQFSLKELELATNHFKELIGQGSFGPVFLGRLYNGSEVAIKRRSDTSQVGTDSFLNEVMSHFLLLLLPFWDTTTNHGRDHLRFYKMTSIQNKVSLYCSGGKFYKHLVNKLGPPKKNLKIFVE
jgi:hypothetical protein